METTTRGETHARRVLESYRNWTGKTLIETGNDGNGANHLAEALYHSPIVVLSHGTETDPVLNYGNMAALALWEMDWDTFTRTPSRLTAEPMEREERRRFLAAVAAHGYVDNYTGIRISSTGKRFYIVNAVVWNVVDEHKKYIGQAAAFAEYRRIHV